MPSDPQLSDGDIAEIRRCYLRKGSTEQLLELHQLATARDEHSTGAALSLVGAALEAAEIVRDAARRNPEVFKAIAKRMSKWPAAHSLFPGDQDGVLSYLRKIELGTESPLSFGKWRLKAPGTKWAFAYWQQAESCKSHKGIYGDFAGVKVIACSGGAELIELFDGVKCFRSDAAEAVSLPVLIKDSVPSWADAFRRHIQRHYPGYSVCEHHDWRHVVAGRNKDPKWVFGKILGEVQRGFKRIAKS